MHHKNEPKKCNYSNEQEWANGGYSINEVEQLIHSDRQKHTQINNARSLSEFSFIVLVNDMQVQMCAFDISSVMGMLVLARERKKERNASSIIYGKWLFHLHHLPLHAISGYLLALTI